MAILLLHPLLFFNNAAAFSTTNLQQTTSIELQGKNILFVKLVVMRFEIFDDLRKSKNMFEVQKRN